MEAYQSIKLFLSGVRMFVHKSSAEPGPIIWLVDAFCFTPWYTAELTRSLINNHVNVRLVCPEIAQEPGLLRALGLTADAGPFNFSAAEMGPRGWRRFVRHSAIMLNMGGLLFALRSGPSRPALIHLQQTPLLNHGIDLDFAYIAAAQHAGVRVIHTVHNMLPHDSMERLRSSYGRLYRLVDHLICHDGNTATRLQDEFKVPVQKITVIPHGPLFATDHIPNARDVAEARALLQLPINRVIVLWHGVLAPYKGLDVLLHAWRLMLLTWRDRLGLEPLLIIAGDGPPALVASVADKVGRLGDSVHAVLQYIPVEKLPLYLAAADILVYCHKKVTTSGALLTGLSYGKPIVASNLPSFRTYLTEGENALLVEPDNAHELAHALSLLLHDAAMLHGGRRGILENLIEGAGRNRQRYMGWDEIGSITRSLYERVLSQTHTRLCA